MTQNPPLTYTFSMLKPDATSCHVVGKIIDQIESTPGIRIAYMQTAYPDAQDAAQHTPPS